MKTFIPVSRILIMKTTLSYFPGMFENPALAVKTNCKINNFFKQRSQNLNDLFGIKIIFLRYESYVATF